MAVAEARAAAGRWWRDERVLAALAQVAVAAGIVLGLAWVAAGVLEDLRSRGLVPGLGFLGQTAGFGIGEGLAFDPTDDYGRALVVGAANTLRVALPGIVLATALGFVVALARLSGNPLLAGVAGAFVGSMRNTPLGIQLVLWIGLLRQLPPIDRALALGPAGGGAPGGPAWALLSLKGAALAWPRPIEGALAPWAIVLLAGLGAAWAVRRWRLARRDRTGAPARVAAWQAAVLAGASLAAWAAIGPPASLELPRVDGPFRYAGGFVASPELAGLLFGLVVYTAAFIAEVVRGGIQSVDAGQREAARALGLSPGGVLRLVVLPQALRVIVPPLTNQYLNLAKNSSLAILIGYPDLFSVGLTVGNQTGQFVVVLALTMAAYLALSLATSAVLNAYGRRVRLVER